jgi:hypothetical protein
MTYVFDSAIADQFGGVENAVFIQNIHFWVHKNAANNMHFHEGKYWTYNSRKAFDKIFTFWSQRQIQRIVKNCEKLGAIEVGNFSEKNYDSTLWFTTTNGVENLLGVVSREKSIMANGLTQTVQDPDPNGSTITDNKQHIYTSITLGKKSDLDLAIKILKNSELTIEAGAMQNSVSKAVIIKKIPEFILQAAGVGKEYSESDLKAHFLNWLRRIDLKELDKSIDEYLEWFTAMFNRVSNREFKPTAEIKTLLAKQIANGFTGAQMEAATRNMWHTKNTFHRKGNYEFATPIHLLKDDNLNRLLNVKF